MGSLIFDSKILYTFVNPQNLWTYYHKHCMLVHNFTKIKQTYKHKKSQLLSTIISCYTVFYWKIYIQKMVSQFILKTIFMWLFFFSDPQHFTKSWSTKIIPEASASWRLKLSNLKKILKSMQEYYTDTLHVNLGNFPLPDVSKIGKKSTLYRNTLYEILVFVCMYLYMCLCL